MEFTNLVEMVQVFANEYCEPASTILVYGNVDKIELIKQQFKFISSEVISVNTSPGKNVDVLVENNFLPFESHSFDLIISFKDTHPEFKRVLKSNGKLLTTNLVIDALDTYLIKNQSFYVT